MKTKSLFTLPLVLLLTAFLSPAFAGHTENLIQTGNTWRVLQQHPDSVLQHPDVIGSPMLQGTRYTALEYYFDTDTTINQHDYKVLLADITSWFEPHIDPSDVRELTTIERKYRGAMRTVNDRVFYWSGQSTMEEMLYNFDLQVQDYLPVSAINPNGNLQIQHIDYVMVGGESVKRFTVGTATQPSLGQIVSGLGTDKGLLEPIENGTVSSELVCFGVDGFTHFPAGSTDCGPEFMATPVEEIRNQQGSSASSGSVSPNPLGSLTGHQGQLWVEAQREEIYRYNITDAQGRIVAAGTGFTNQPNPIDASTLVPGMYFVRVQQENGYSPLNLRWLVQ